MGGGLLDRFVHPIQDPTLVLSYCYVSSLSLHFDIPTFHLISCRSYSQDHKYFSMQLRDLPSTGGKKPCKTYEASL